jgi:two-component system LytT family response regulator
VTVRRVLIADDEPLARERLRDMLGDGAPSPYRIVAECGDGPATVEAILEHRPEIVFLDVRMPGLDGLEVLSALEDARLPPAIVFVTAYDAYAVRAFDVSAVDYLLKPFDAGRFAQALARVEQRLTNRPGAAVDAELKGLLRGLKARQPYPERFLVRAPKHLYFVRAADIDWVDGASNYVRLHIGGRTHLVRDTLKAIGAKLRPDRFVRVHRSVIVNIDRVERLEPSGHGEYRLTLRDGTRITSSRGHNRQLRTLLQ